MEQMELKGQFLIAMPQLLDLNFYHTLVLLCEHGKEGAFGLVVNRPSPFHIGQLCQTQGIEAKACAEDPIFCGGPVQPDLGCVLYEGDEHKGSLPILPDLWLGTSLGILRDLTTSSEPRRFLFFVGYAGWAPDQLEGEISRNDWLLAPGNAELIFGVPAELRWEMAIRSLGIDPGFLSQDVGTA